MSSRVDVHLGERSYSIHVENGLLKRGGKLISSVCRPSKILVLSTKPIFKICGKSFCDSVKSIGAEVHYFLMPDGEIGKNEKTLFLILNKMAQLSFQRDSCLVALGGGVVGDLGGFAASIYMRGIHFVQCPTTFLAQVDAGIGGKTAIDFRGIKNLVGSFYQPKIVLVDPTVLNSLSDRQIKTGLAEVVKYGVIYDEKMFRKLELNIEAVLRKKSKILTDLILRSCQIKAKIVSADEKEGGKRAWLNYGHTLGHALESYFNYRVLTHGEAIAYGMWFASELSVRLGICSEEVMRRQIRLLKTAGLFRKLPNFNIKKVYAKMVLDKKARRGQIQFVLTRKIGLVTIRKNVPKSIIFSILSQLRDVEQGNFKSL